MTASLPTQQLPPTEQKLQEPAPRSSSRLAPQAQATPAATPTGQQITNKNVLNPKTLEALNQTQHMFPSFQLQNPAKLSLNQTYSVGLGLQPQHQTLPSPGLHRVNRQDSMDRGSIQSGGSRLSMGRSVHRIGGLARRKLARESTKAMAELKKSLSLRDQNSLLGNSSASPSPHREARSGALLRESMASNLLLRAEMEQVTNVAACQIQVAVKEENKKTVVEDVPAPVEEDPKEK